MVTSDRPATMLERLVSEIDGYCLLTIQERQFIEDKLVGFALAAMHDIKVQAELAQYYLGDD